MTDEWQRTRNRIAKIFPDSVSRRADIQRVPFDERCMVAESWRYSRYSHTDRQPSSERRAQSTDHVRLTPWLLFSTVIRRYFTRRTSDTQDPTSCRYAMWRLASTMDRYIPYARRESLRRPLSTWHGSRSRCESVAGSSCFNETGDGLPPSMITPEY